MIVIQPLGLGPSNGVLDLFTPAAEYKIYVVDEAKLLGDAPVDRAEIELFQVGTISTQGELIGKCFASLRTATRRVSIAATAVGGAAMVATALTGFFPALGPVAIFGQLCATLAHAVGEGAEQVQPILDETMHLESTAQGIPTASPEPREVKSMRFWQEECNTIFSTDPIKTGFVKLGRQSQIHRVEHRTKGTFHWVSRTGLKKVLESSSCYRACDLLPPALKTLATEQLLQVPVMKATGGDWTRPVQVQLTHGVQTLETASRDQSGCSAEKDGSNLVWRVNWIFSLEKDQPFELKVFLDCVTGLWPKGSKSIDFQLMTEGKPGLREVQLDLEGGVNVILSVITH